ncbi:pyridoxamine 5'-phosphate oxidase [Panus rudis PR-1116 ss-1]|nr:pyridoxamine 5'-phosphate oxidase [Panus rudis PR-1116 ss-1]
MDVVLPAPHQLKVLSHNQYNPPEHLTPTSVQPSPIDQFRTWFTEVQGHVREPEAMCVSTVTRTGVPSSRYVLFKELDSRGFVFYTNYTSRKSRELEENPRAALAFYWREVSRQVRVVGRVEKLSREQSEEYFKSRPLGSRVGAWASPQSQVVEEGELLDRLDKVKEQFGVTNETTDADIPLPDFWGGWRVIPYEIEFWSGKPSRLHDRVRYLRVEGSADDNPQWKIERLAP